MTAVTHPHSLRRVIVATAAALGATYASALFAAPAQAATTVTMDRGVLAIEGDGARNSLVVGQTPRGVITLNGAAVLEGAATIGDVNLIVADGGPGDDTLRVDETNGTMPSTLLIGGAGNDQLSGGSGDDQLFGGDGIDAIDGRVGDDTLLGQAGNDKIIGGRGTDFVLSGEDADQFTWNPGDGSDVVEGGAGKDTLLFNGSAASEIVRLSTDGGHLRLTRNVAAVTMSVGGFELVRTDLSSGEDLVDVTDMTGAGTTQLQVALTPTSNGDASDAVRLTGTSGADRIRITGPSITGTVIVSGLPATVLVTGTDALQVQGLAGNDVIDAAGLSVGAVVLSEFGGADNDILVGTPGNDTLRGDDGDDRLEGRGGDDTLDGGGGENVIIP